MDKREFIYLKKSIRALYYLIIIPVIILIPDVIRNFDGVLYWGLNFALLIPLIFIAGKISGCDRLPGVKRKGYFWKEGGFTVIQTEFYQVKLDDVKEIMISDRSKLTKSVLFDIKNGKEHYEFMSEVLNADDITDTTFYTIFNQILAENPDLVQEKDIFGEPIDYWYKK